MTIQELAKQLGISVGAVRMRSYRGALTITNGEIDDLVAYDIIRDNNNRGCFVCDKQFRPVGHQKYCSVKCKEARWNPLRRIHERMHPLQSEKIAGKKGEDKRVKLSDADKEEIRYRRKQGESMRELARAFNVDRRLIQFTVYPERYAHARELFKARRKDGRYKESKEKHREDMAKHRAHKREVLEEKGIL